MPSSGKETSEWGAMQWIKWGAGLLALNAVAFATVLPLAGVVEPNSLVVVVLGIVASVAAVISGKAVSDYGKGRVDLKKREALARSASLAPVVSLDEVKKLLDEQAALSVAAQAAKIRAGEE